MIKRISKLSYFGTFSNFNWDGKKCQNFKKYNFIYGWNYSGKTTFSRLFQCLEQKQLNPDYPDLQFKIETDNRRFTNKNLENHNLIIRVFNEDFIEKNFKWNDEGHGIDPVLILGEENVELNDKLKDKNKEKENKEAQYENLKNEIKTLNENLEKSLTNKASEIRKILNITNPKEFDRTKLEEKIINLKGNYKNFIFQDNDLQLKLKTYRDQKIYENINEVTINFKLQDLKNKTNQLLSKKITAQQIIQKLKDNPELNRWVREGIDLHKDEKECQFCGNKLPEDLFERLNKHFSEEYDNLMNEIKSLETEIGNYKKEIEGFTFTDKSRFFEEFQEVYEKKRKELSDNLTKIADFTKIILEKLNEKRNKPFDIIENVSIDDDCEKKTNFKLKELNEIIEKNNIKIRGLEEEKKRIKEDLIKHHSAIAIDELEYLDKIKEFDTKNQMLKQVEEEIKKIEGEINSIKDQLSQVNIGLKKINTYLKEFFSDDQLQLKPIQYSVEDKDGKYQIYRKDVIAKNLSTGEKNIIALVYFITKLEENNFDLNNAVIFIDDPVSSLDSNHIFRAYAFLGEKLLNCGQLFITTHNFEFFNLLKDLIRNSPQIK